MSYILEALRRADSERERGGVPGIHARPLPSELSQAPDGGWFTRPLAWAGAALALLLAAVLAWQALKDEPPAAMTSATPPPIPAPTTSVAPASGAAALPAPVPVTPAPPRVTTAHEDRPEAARPAPVVMPPAARELLAAEEAASRQRAAKSAAPVASQPAAAVARQPARAAAPASAAVAASAAPAAEAPILGLRELPEDVRRSLPALAIGGSVYSANPAGRFVVINGQIVHEGDKLGPELMLEQIRLKSAVLRYRTHRFEIDY